MRYASGQREDTRAKILTGASQGFRRLGYGGIGVDGIAKQANVTSGAFYGHFASKADAFRAAAVAGLVELRDGIELLKSDAGKNWLEAFVDFYLSTKRTCELGESCALQSLTLDVARADDSTKAAYQEELQKVVGAMASGLQGRTDKERRHTALAILSILSGGVTMARSVNDEDISSHIAKAVKTAALAMVSD
jgi:TetR/AcrR family transcriptional regulator, transcriptional repressor for nem operon